MVFAHFVHLVFTPMNISFFFLEVKKNFMMMIDNIETIKKVTVNQVSIVLNSVHYVYSVSQNKGTMS